MARIGCPCGNVFSTVMCPNDSMHVIPDKDYSEYSKHIWQQFQLCDIERNGMLPDKDTEESDLFHNSLYRSMDLEGELWECAKCGRLLWRRPGEKTFRSFFPEIVKQENF
jgi:hypothetical protein